MSQIGSLTHPAPETKCFGAVFVNFHMKTTIIG